MEGVYLRILRAEAYNFGSYEKLTFDFTDLGLSIVSGNTGSGKSTLQDVVPWILFGVTSKNGNADDIRSWTSEQDTFGVVELETDLKITVTRIRGKTKDLYWVNGASEEKIRGKDLTETQNLLEKKLGISSDLFLTAVHFNEFSKTGNFFTNKAKDRKHLFETIVNLQLPILISERAANEKKQEKKGLQYREKSFAELSGKLRQLRDTLADAKRRKEVWDKDQQNKLSRIKTNYAAFDKNKQITLDSLLENQEDFERTKARQVSKIQDLIDTANANLSVGKKECSECGQPDENYTRWTLEKTKLENKLLSLDVISPYIALIEQEKSKENPFLYQNTYEEVNPFNLQMKGVEDQIFMEENTEKDSICEIEKVNAKISDLSILYDLSYELRGELLSRTVRRIESETNRYLTDHFDGEIRVSFEITGADNLEVSIQKNGYLCSYNQLSRGQRSLLKLCFSVALMKMASNEAGTSVNILCFDECLDGLNSDLKIKSLSLFQTLEKEYESILVIDHASEIYPYFNRHFHIDLINDCSIIKEK